MLNTFRRDTVKFLRIRYKCNTVGRVYGMRIPKGSFLTRGITPNFLIACKCSALTRSTGPRRRDIGLFIRNSGTIQRTLCRIRIRFLAPEKYPIYETLRRH